MEPSPRLVVLLGLLALVPGAVYLVARSELLAAVALLNIVLIVGTLFVAFSPHESQDAAEEVA